jgi:hypothetical protein
MARGVVHHDVDVEIARDVFLDRIQEATELLRAVARHALADDGAGLDVERGEQRRRAVPLVVVGPPLDLPGAHRQQPLGPVEGLDLRLLVDQSTSARSGGLR